MKTCSVLTLQHIGCLTHKHKPRNEVCSDLWGPCGSASSNLDENQNLPGRFLNPTPGALICSGVDPRNLHFLKVARSPERGEGSGHPQSHTLGCSKRARSLLSKDALPNSGAAREVRSCVSPAQTHGPPAAQSIRKHCSALEEHHPR